MTMTTGNIPSFSCFNYNYTCLNILDININKSPSSPPPSPLPSSSLPHHPSLLPFFIATSSHPSSPSILSLPLPTSPPLLPSSFTLLLFFLAASPGKRGKERGVRGER